MPEVVLAGSDRAAVVCAIVDGKVERYCAVATSRVTSGVCWCVGAGIVGVAVPNETIADGDSLRNRVTRVDSQVQSICTWTTVVVGVVMGIYSRRIVVNFVP